jgi:putative copper resistance protein D
MAALLLGDWSALRTPYGLALIAKVALFALLMLLAAANRWRFGPRIARGASGALGAFRLTVVTEWLLIFVVTMLTALMTSLLAPA